MEAIAWHVRQGRTRIRRAQVCARYALAAHTQRRRAAPCSRRASRVLRIPTLGSGAPASCAALVIRAIRDHMAGAVMRAWQASSRRSRALPRAPSAGEAHTAMLQQPAPRRLADIVRPTRIQEMGAVPSPTAPATLATQAPTAWHVLPVEQGRTRMSPAPQHALCALAANTRRLLGRFLTSPA